MLSFDHYKILVHEKEQKVIFCKLILMMTFFKQLALVKVKFCFELLQDKISA